MADVPSEVAAPNILLSVDRPHPPNVTAAFSRGIRPRSIDATQTMRQHVAKGTLY
jgi:hypothetical protein